MSPRSIPKKKEKKDTYRKPVVTRRSFPQFFLACMANSGHCGGGPTKTPGPPWHCI